jgi:hypothetical protein
MAKKSREMHRLLLLLLLCLTIPMQKEAETTTS